MNWNIRLVYVNSSTRKCVELRKVHYDFIGQPISHSTFIHDSTNQAEENLFETLVNEAFEKPILKFAS